MIWYLMSFRENGEFILLSKGCCCFFLIAFDWEFYQGFSLLFNMKMNKINPSDNFFLYTINTIFSLFIWILWNESGGKCLHIYILMVNENLACSFSWGCCEITTVACSIDKVLITSSQLINLKRLSHRWEPIKRHGSPVISN